MHVESLGKPHDSTSALEALPGKLDIKRHLFSILYITSKAIVCCSVFKIFLYIFSAYIDHRYEREEQILSVLKTDPDEYKSTLKIVRTVYQVNIMHQKRIYYFII